GSVAIGDNASTHSARTTAIGYKAEAHNADSIAIGSGAKTDDNGGGIAIGTSTSAAYGGLAIGKSANALNDDSLAIGNGAVADVNKSISIGYNAGVGTAEDNKEKNGSLVAIGTSAGNNVKGMQNVAIGASAGSSVLSSNNIAIGTNAGYGIKNVTSTTDTNPQNGYNISIGAGANYTEGNTNQNIVSSIAIGHATHAVNRAVALGEGASAQGDSGMALGNSATSSGSGSIAIGNTASASKGNIALGAGAIATGTPTGTGKWTNTAAPSYYISVGGKGNASDSTITLRRISNVADGSADQDVVTVKQLQKVSDDLENTIKGIDTSQLKTYSATEIDNKIAEVNQNIKDSGVKYFSINSASQSTNSNNTGANGDGDADAMAIGPNAKASSVKALAIGNNVSASGTLSIAIGTANDPSTDTTTADNPHPTSSEGTSSVAIGTSAIAQTDNSIAIGTRATTYTANTTSSPVTKIGIQSIAIGYGAETRDNNAIAFGTGAKANSAASIAIGDNAQALNENAVVIGTSSTAYGTDSVTLGKNNTNNGKGVMTTGNSNSVTNSQSAADVVQNSGIYGSLNKIQSVSSSNSSNAITDVYAVGNSNKLNQVGEKNVLNDVSIMGNNNTIENGTAGAYTQTVKQIAVVGSGNTVKGNTDINTTTWGTVQRDTILGYNNTVDATKQSTPVSNLQILGNDVTATLGNSVYLGTGSSATASKSATAEAIQLAKDQGDAEAIASDEYKNATTEAEQTAIKQKYEAQHIHAANIVAMDKDGISAGIINYDTDYTYGNDSSYAYAGSNPTGVVTVGSKDATRRIQNVSAGLVGPNSTDAVNGSQLYALTRQIRFGGDNSTFGDAAANDVNVVAKGSNEKLAITGGAEGVSVTTTTDGKSVTTVDGTKITDKNIAVIAENDALHVKLASNLKNLNTASIGKTTTGTAEDGSTTTSYQETLKLDGTGDNGGTLALKDAKGENGVTLRTSGTTTTADVNGNGTTRLLVNNKTVATTDDGLKFGGDTGNDSALKLNNKLNIKGGADTTKLTDNNIGVVSDGNGTLTVKLNKNVNLGADGSLTTGTVTATTVTTGNSTLDNTGLTITGGPKFTSTGISANNQQIKNVKAGTDDTDAANYSQIKEATTTLTTGKNGNVNVTTNTTPTADGHTNYTIAVDNLAVKANGTGNTTVELAKGINFKDGANTTAAVGSDGTVTINATHNKLDSASYTASKPSDASNQTTVKLKDTDGNETTLNLTDTYTTVSKNTDHTITFKRNDGSDPVSVSLDDLNGASKEALTTAAAKATTTVIKGNNVDSVEDDTTSADGHHIYKVNVSNLGVKVADGQKKSVALSEGLVFGNGTNTTASVGDNGAITFNVSDAAIKTKAKDAINMTASSNVKVETATSTDGLSKTFTISATHNALKSATLTKGTNDVSTLTITGNDGDTASVDIKNTYLTVSKDSKAKTVTFTSNDGTTPATTLSLSDFGAASTTDMTAAVAKATTEVKAGTNATLGNLETDPTDQHKIYTVNVDNLGLKQNGTTAGNGTGVSLKNGLNFTDGTNTTASVKEDGTVSYSVSNDAIKAQAKDAVVVAAGDNVSIDTPTDANNVKTYTVRVNNLQLQADGVNKATRKLADGINFAGGTNTTADVTADGKVTYNLKDSISLNQVQTGDSTLNTNGLTITNGPIFTKNKIDANNQQITNVASGGDVATNAATIGDLNSAIQKASEGTTASGFKTKGNYGDAVTSRLDKQLNVLGDVDTTKVAEQNLSNGNVGVVTSTDNAGNATLTVKLNKDINLGEKGSVTTGNTVMNDAGITNGNMSLGANGLTIKDSGDTSKIKVAVTDSNVTMGGNVIHNVGAGTETTDAVNKGQLDALQKQVSGGWNLSGRNSDGTAVTAQIGAGETVTYNNGNYTKAVVTKDDSNNATVKVDVTTGTFGSNAGTVTSTTNGLATTGAVANAINSASWTIQDGNNIGNAQQVKAGDTVSLKAGDNLSLDQNGKEFTYKLNKTLQNMTSVTAVDDKQNTAVLNGEGLKVSDKEGDSLTQHATEVRLHSATAATEDTSKDVVLNNAGLTIGDNVKFTNNGISAGNQKITNVADGEVQTDSKEAVNGGQLYELQQKVTNGWKITGNDTTKAGNIGNDKTVSFVNGDNSYIKAKVYTTNTGATVSYTAQTASLMKNAEGKAALNGTTDGLVTGTNLTNVLNSLSWTAQSSKTGTGQNNGSTTAQSITAGTNVGFIAGDNMILTQDGTNFTYALNSNLTGMNTIAFTGLGNGASNLTIGLQDGGGANPDRGYYITGLSNTKWDQSNYEGSRAATEAQLREAIDKVSAATGTGGFGLTADEGANNGGEKKVSQTLGSTIAIQGDGTYDAEGKVVKQGNISTVAYTDNAGPTGAIKVKLNKDIDLSEAGSLTIGASKVSAGSIVLGNTSDAAKKIALNSTAGIASIGGVTVNGAEKTVNGLSNTKWTGKAVDGQAATENQLVEAINEAKKQAANSELHIRKGVYAIGKDSQGQDVTDTKGKNSVSIDVVNAKGAVDGQVVINDVAKASELGTVGELADNLKNPNGGPTTVVQAVNKVNQKVDDSLKQVNGDVTNAVTEAKKHTEVKSVDSDNNVTIDGTTTNADGGTVYKLGLNKDHLNLGNVHVYGNEGRVTAKTVESETVKIDDQTRLDKTGLTTGNTTVANNRIVVGGDNGIKMEANGGQQTISGLTNTDWTGTAVHGRAATEDQLAKAISSATTTAAQNEQHIKAGTYDIQTTTDDKGNKQNKVTMKIVDGTGKDKGTVTINDVAKASDVGDTDKLVADIKNRNGGQPQTTSVVEAVNNLNEKVNTRVGDNKYSAITSKDAVQDGDNSTTAIAKLNNRMTDIYHNATQHSSVAVDGNLTLDDKGINKSGGTEYKIGLNKDQINLGNLTIKGNEGSIEAKSIKSDSFTAGDTVVNKDGVKVGDKSALTGDSLKVNGKTYVDDKGVNANGQVIRNVGEGKDDGDAVNVKQVNDLAARQGESIDRNTAHINQLGQAVNKLGNRLNRVGAGAAALAALHPGTYDPNDKWDFSAGVGHYHDANAVAIGAYYHPNDTTILSIGGSMGGGENMVNAGITWKMGRSGREQAAQPVVVRKAEAAPVVQQAAQVRPAPVVVPVPAVTPAPVTTPAPVKSVAPATPVQAAPAVTTPMMPAAPSN
uniref:YadA-like family protein n=1 Tax=uncultured Megasphaera sp. TaxID=165188 RepID=UPI00262AC29A